MNLQAVVIVMVSLFFMSVLSSPRPTRPIGRVSILSRNKRSNEDDVPDVAWSVGAWEACKNGKHWRPVRCYHGDNQIVLSECEEQLTEPKPANEKDCAEHAPPKESNFKWGHGPWENCAIGVKRRSVECYQLVELDLCRNALPAEEPIDEQDCVAPAPPVELDLFWRVQPWEECVDDEQWRPVECYHHYKGQIFQVDEDECLNISSLADEVPVSWRECEK